MNRKVIATARFALFPWLTMTMAQAPAQAEGSTASLAATPQVATKGSARSARESATAADARLCVEFPTTTQVIMCAEKYRPDRRRS